MVLLKTKSWVWSVLACSSTTGITTSRHWLGCFQTFTPQLTHLSHLPALIDSTNCVTLSLHMLWPMQNTTWTILSVCSSWAHHLLSTSLDLPDHSSPILLMWSYSKWWSTLCFVRSYYLAANSTIKGNESHTRATSWSTMLCLWWKASYWRHT